MVTGDQCLSVFDDEDEDYFITAGSKGNLGIKAEIFYFITTKIKTRHVYIKRQQNLLSWNEED